ncbi:ABC transporter ATP-binding protein [Clavibacter michiganensis]|uniref:ABC transporter permease n=5 Tax=Clavibacter michiganensis TaxID=28447 RepID=A0A0D5CEB2_9MICO|nr:ABC transporter ATP-binding protein [Clavibacter michiganensis]AJW77978.1 ABC transporter permease [Clavibacter michiganensis subsp. insidiosus]AWF99655.1 ABC transporter permease [Clavibacter michiganensis subsp. insidiosus]AWG00225.1 ABC transporter permease [Clavibacter michiganensis subsp. insidiosus]OQJ61128.1 ABC transporter permease [Clavibacter michiganensis subsp. insidiosus]RMC86182.1 ABC transporter ATP-binding protein [Clavibacter michiganensis subsp. insidiosus]
MRAIDEARRTLGPAGERELRPVVARMAAASVLHGAAALSLVPVLERLFGADPASAWPWIALFLLLAAAHLAVQARAQSAAFGAGVRAANALHHRIGDHVVRLPLAWFDATHRAELTAAAGGSVLASMGVPAYLLRPLITAAVVPAVIALGLLVVDPPLGAALLVAAPVLVLALRVGGRIMARADAERTAADTGIGERVVEFAQAQHVLRAHGRTGRDAGLVDAILVRHRAASRALIGRTVAGLVAFGAVMRVVLVVALVIAVDRAVGGPVDPGRTVAALVLVFHAADLVGQGAELAVGVRAARRDVQAVGRILDAAPIPEPQPASARVPAGADVELDGVSFSYPGSRAEAVAGLDATLPAGRMTALVGPSGSGKTTVARLLARAADVTGGSVRIGGVDVRDMALADVAANVSTVFQDVHLLAGTLGDNVRIADPDADDAAVVDALRRAGLPLGDGLDLDTPVGEGGRQLSGGQRQRVSIARVLLKDAPVVVLDEATAALDAESAAAVGEAIRLLRGHRTLLVIAHRLDTVRSADEILVLDGGRLVQRGTHDELAGEPGVYAEFLADLVASDGWRVRAQYS